MADVKSVILGEGDDARAINEKKASAKVRFLKKGAGFRGYFLTTKFVAYRQHGSFEAKIQSHACLDPKNRKACPSCAAGVNATTKTLVFWWDADAKEIVVRDVSKTAMATIYQVVDTYSEDLMTTLFNVSLGEKGAVNVLAVPASKAKGVEPAPTDIVIDDELLGYVMNVCTPDEIEKLIAGKVEAKTNDDATIVRKDGDGQAPGPEGENGTKLF